MRPFGYLFITMTAIFAMNQANAGFDPVFSLSAIQNSEIFTYTSIGGKDCLILDAEEGFNKSDLPGLKKLINDIDVTAGPGILPESAPEGSLPYSYALIPNLQGTKLVYKGLLPTTHTNGVQVKTRNGKSIYATIYQDLPRKIGVRLIFLQSCE